MKIAAGEYYYWTTREPLTNNTVTLSDFLNYELGDDSDWEVVHSVGSYAEIENVDTGAILGVHASGDGDFCNHKVEFVNLSLPEVTLLEVESYSLDCPYCGSIEDGFLGDCRCETLKCDSCGKYYRIHEEADLENI